MYRAILYIGSFLIVVSGLGLAVPQSMSYMTLVLPSGWPAVGSLFLSLFLMDFAIFDFLRTKRAKRALGMLSAVLFLLAALGMLTESLRPANGFVLLLGGIACLTAALEFERPGTGDQAIWVSRLYLKHHLYTRAPRARRHSSRVV